MDLSPATERAIDMCYDAITVPDRWDAALDSLAHSLGASACIILPHEISDRQFGVVCSSGIHRLEEIREWNQWTTPVYEPRGDPYVRRGYEAVSLLHLFTEEELKRSRFHQEVARPAGCEQWTCGIFLTEGRHWCMPFFRGGEPFSLEILEPLAQIARRISKLVAISEKISRSSAAHQILTLERMGCAALLVDRHGRISRANRHAEALACPDFGIRHGKLWTSSSRSLARLDRFMAEIDHARSAGHPLPQPIIIGRGGIPWLLVEAMPLSSAITDIFDGGRAILVVTDIARPSFTNVALLGTIFGLTGAEARLAAAICDGQDLETLALAQGVSRQTLRSQLKQVFAKTGTHRQAELVARVASIRNARH